MELHHARGSLPGKGLGKAGVIGLSHHPNAMHTGCLAGPGPRTRRRAVAFNKAWGGATPITPIASTPICSDGQSLFRLREPADLEGWSGVRAQARSCRPLSLGSGKIRRRGDTLGTLFWERAGSF